MRVCDIVTKGASIGQMAQAAQINPRILSWARETAGLSLEEAAAKLGLTNTTRLTDPTNGIACSTDFEL